MAYTILADGNVLHSYEAGDASMIALKPRLELDINGAGSLSFVLPPGHALHGSLKRLKTIVTVELDGEEIFCGRVMEHECDIYNQITVTCEGATSFLRDSLYEFATFNGSAQELFRNLIENHNAKVEESKRFTVGSITAVNAQTALDEEIKVETRKFWDTQTVINDRLLNVYGGYIKTRKVGNARYIDWVKEYGGTSSQEIKFAVNLLDLKNKTSGEDVFTVLIPLGYSEMGSDGKYTDPVTIASVNGGVEYIQDDAGVALHGKIWRTNTWGQTKEPSKLLEKAREYLKTGGAFQSLTLKAVDMHIIDGSISAINIGDKVRIVSDPNGVNLLMVCSKMVIDLVDPENSEYTFGEKPRTLTEGIASTKKDVNNLSGRGGGGGRKSLEEEMQDIIRWAKINVDEANAQILLSTGEIDNLKKRTNQAEIAIDGVEASIVLHAESINDLEGLMTQAEIDINGLEAAVKIKANQTAVDALTGRVSTAESTLTVQAGQISTKVSKDGVSSAINQTEQSVLIKASKINLSGYVTASELAAEMAAIDNLTSGVTEASVLKATMLNCTSIFMFQNSAVSWGSKSVLTGVTLTQSKNVAKVRGVDGSEITLNYVTNVTPSPSSSTLQYLTKTT